MGGFVARHPGPAAGLLAAAPFLAVEDGALAAEGSVDMGPDPGEA